MRIQSYIVMEQVGLQLETLRELQQFHLYPNELPFGPIRETRI